MTTLTEARRYYQHVVLRLEHANQSWWLYTFMTGLLACGSVVVGYFLLCLAIDGIVVALPSGVRIGLLIGWAVVGLAAAGFLVIRPLAWRRPVEATARRVEAAFPELRNDLINALQLAEDPVAEGNPFVPLAVAQAADEADRVPLARANQQEGWWRRLRLCVCGPRDLVLHLAVLTGLVVGLLIYAALWPDAYGWALSRFFAPTAFVPRQGAVRLVSVEPGTAEVTVDSPLTVKAVVDNPAHVRYEGWLWRRSGSEEERLEMRARQNYTEYVVDFAAVKVGFTYRLEIGGTESEIYTVTAHPRPAVGTITATYEYPAYTGLAPRRVEQRNGDIEAPQYTEVTLRVESSSPVAKAKFQIAGEKRERVCSVDEQDRRIVTGKLPVLESGSYTIHLFDERNFSNANPRVNVIKAVPDRPPTIEISKPGQNVELPPGSVLSLVIAAGDDYGLTSVELVAIRSDGTRETSRVQKVWSEFPDPKKATLVYDWKLDAASYGPGEVLSYVAVAKDNRRVQSADKDLGPQQTQSARYQVRVSKPEQASQQALESLDQIRQRLMKILRRQIAAHQATLPLKQAKEPAQAQPPARHIKAEQIGIREETLDCAKAVPTLDEDNRQLKQVLTNLAATPMVAAVDWADKIAAGPEADKLAGRVEGLLAEQQKIIVILEKVLDVVRFKENELLKKAKKTPGDDLPTDVVQKLKDLHDKLKEFLEEQRKVIEATQNLAKKPVEDFTEEEKQQLKDLAATEDKWEKFLAEKYSDLSKLPKQDFSNPSMLEELIEIQTEIKMAKDALTQKTAELAVPLEQLGAEMAEELTTHIEKWLPETPDREKWSQEEPLKSDMTEAPMAELPKELEDLVGELMEEEEDLFQEAEDVSSSWADSLDKGAGWDAVDGPISNMSAQGVTGNRLPNTNEIGGRSGEGRSGKSSGEFVGEEAVGKGGRRTPSRLTPDPFEKGVVKDRSREPVGGATGGGKESGQGGVGLEGPVPPQLNREMQRLAGKQGELRRKGEAIDIKLRVRNYNTTEWEKILAAMGRAAEQLAQGKYQNTLREQHILIRGLDSMKQYVRGEYVVQKDRSVSLPRTTLEEILDSMETPSPKGWDELNRKYFEKLSQ